jgi:hypothetical protein
MLLYTSSLQVHAPSSHVPTELQHFLHTFASIIMQVSVVICTVVPLRGPNQDTDLNKSFSFPVGIITTVSGIRTAEKLRAKAGA